VLVEPYIKIDVDGTLYTYDGETKIKQAAIDNDLWHHFRINFNVNTDVIDVYIDGILIDDDISRTMTPIPDIEFRVYNEYFILDPTRTNTSSVYLDAIDYSWDTDYYTFRNYAWDYSLTNVSYYEDLYKDLSIFTDISTDLSENIVEMDTTTDIAEFDFYLDLDGSHNPTVNFTFTLPDGFTISPESTISQALNANIEFNITATDSYQYAGIYYVGMNITFSSNTTSIYYEDIPFRIPIVDDFTITQSGIIFEEDEFNGNYTSTYDFLDEAVGTEEDDISWIDWYDDYKGDQIVEIASGLGGHNHIVNMTDNDASEGYYARDVKFFNTLQLVLTLELILM
jgi:hypothetical protein